MKSIQKRMFLYLFVYLGVILSLGSTWVNNLVHFSQFTSRALAILAYLPFALAILYKFLTDVSNVKVASSSYINWCYYAFALYYVVLSIYRLLNGMEVKENMYYSLIFFGAIAIYLLLRDNILNISKCRLDANLVWIATFFILYRFIYCVIGVRFFSNPPINLNLTSGAVALLLPFLGDHLANSCRDKNSCIFRWVVVLGCIVVIATTGARAIYLLSVVNIAVLLVMNIVNRKGFIRIISAVIIGSIVVVMLAVANVGDVRYSLYRQTGLNVDSIQMTLGISNPTETQIDIHETMPTDDACISTEPILPIEPTEQDITDIADTPEDTTDIADTPEDTTNQKQIAAQNQVNASDKMRSDLIGYGMDQVVQNPLFGTGDVLYWYQITEEYGFMQSSHNFVIEAIVCYGCIGLLLIAVLFFAILIDTKIFVKLSPARWNTKITLALTLLFYFAFGFVQPTVFDMIICLLFVLTVATCRDALYTAD